MGKGKRLKARKPKLPFFMPSAVWSEISMPIQFRSADGKRLDDSKAFVNTVTGMRIIISAENHGRDGHWVHISASFPDRVPEYAELRELKNEFLGPEKEAYQVLPKESEYVNMHEHTLHIWHCVDRKITPQ